jgi:hypothetical protein
MSAFASALITCGLWVPVTPATVTLPVPVICPTNHKWPDKQVNAPLPQSCAIRENGQIVGYRTNCDQKEKS